MTVSGQGDSRPLFGQTALVTGGARRIGRALAESLGRSGANVVVHYGASADEAAAAARQVREYGVRAWTIQADLSDGGQAGELVGRAVGEAGPLDILVNNASIFPAASLETMTPADVAGNVQINAMSPFQIARAFAAQGRPGSVVNLLDSRIHSFDATHVPYHLSKRMLFTLTRLLAVSLAPRVRVNAVAPGLILPPDGETEDYLRRAAAGNYLRRWGSVGQIADAVLFLLRNDFMTGQIIYVDGGQHMRESLYG